MLNKISIIYSWMVRTFFIFFPDLPLMMRFRGFLYSFMMKGCGTNFQVSASAHINSLRGLSCGDNVYLAKGVILLPTDVNLESDVIVGPNTVIVSANHVFDGYSFRNQQSISAHINVGFGSWIASGCQVVAGASLPAHSILAAGSVLSKKYVEERVVYGGVPAKPISRVKL